MGARRVWEGTERSASFQRTDKSLLINIFIHIHSSWLANARVIIDSNSDSNLRSCHAVAIAFWRRWKIQMAAPAAPRSHPLSKLELELGLVLGNASAKQRQVKNVFSFFCVFVFWVSVKITSSCFCCYCSHWRRTVATRLWKQHLKNKKENM